MSTVAVNRKSIGEVESGIRAKRRARARAKTGSLVLNRTLAFFAISVTAYMGTNISGHILIDQARRDASDAKSRLNTATRAVAGLDRRIRDLKSTYSITNWAVANGYEQGEFIPSLDDREATVVAQRD